MDVHSWDFWGEHPRVLIAFKKKVGPVRDISFSTRQPDDVIRMIQGAISANKAAQHGPPAGQGAHCLTAQPGTRPEALAIMGLLLTFSLSAWVAKSRPKLLKTG
jgi:hypothetical protein